MEPASGTINSEGLACGVPESRFGAASPFVGGRVESASFEGVGAGNRVTLCGLLVFVDESAETIMAKNAKAAAGL